METTFTKSIDLASESVEYIIHNVITDKESIEKELGQIGLSVFEKQKHISFTPVYQQNISKKIKNFFAGVYCTYKYMPNKSLKQNIMKFTIVAEKFTNAEIQYLFGDIGVEIKDMMHYALGYYKELLPTNISEKKWNRFIKTR